MRSSRNRTFSFAASVAAASGQTRNDSKTESDREIPGSALGCPRGPLVSSFEFIEPARFYGQVMASGRRPASHAERIGVRKTFDFGVVQRRHRARFVERDVFAELLRQLVLEIMARELGSDPFHQGIEISPLNRWERFRYVGEFPDQRFLFRRNRPQRPARRWRASPSFALVHPSSPINGTKRTSAISSLRYSFSETRVTRTSSWTR